MNYNQSILLFVLMILFFSCKTEPPREQRPCNCTMKDLSNEIKSKTNEVRGGINTDSEIKGEVQKIIKVAASAKINTKYENIQIDEVVEEVINSNKFKKYEDVLFRYRIMRIFYIEYCNAICNDRNISDDEYNRLKKSKLSSFEEDIMKHVDKINNEKEKEYDTEYLEYTAPRTATIYGEGKSVYSEADFASEEIVYTLGGDALTVLGVTYDDENLGLDDNGEKIKGFWYLVEMKEDPDKSGWVFDNDIEFPESPRVKMPEMDEIDKKVKYINANNVCLFSRDYRTDSVCVEIPINSVFLVSKKSKEPFYKDISGSDLKYNGFWYCGAVDSELANGYLPESLLSDEKVIIKEDEKEEEELTEEVFNDWEAADNVNNPNEKSKKSEANESKGRTKQSEESSKVFSVTIKVIKSSEISLREWVKEPEILYGQHQTGQITVNVTISKQGTVIKAKAKAGKSSIKDKAELELTEKWAKGIQFHPAGTKSEGQLIFAFNKNN